MIDEYPLDITVNEIVFIDGGLDDIDILKARLAPGTMCFILDSHKDGSDLVGLLNAVALTMEDNRLAR